ncbi:MAG TPA: GAF domain-containing protein, partial [Candidatus Acidoferrum sp.]|nr:GAF domain-containing protein [Candidatus Acidoferrum sp.]
MTHIDTTVLVFFASALLLGGFFCFLYRQKRQPYLLLWSMGWCVLALKSLTPAFLDGMAWPSLASAIAGWLLICAALLFYSAARLYAGRGPATRWLIAAASLAVFWAVAYSRNFVVVPLSLGAGLVLVVIASVFWREARKRESQSDLLLMFTFGAWAALRILNVFQSRIPGLASQNLSSLDFLPELFAGVLMLMAAYEEERRRVERNMLALSNLNLATSSFVGSEIQKMLAQGLERVLNVARIPAGALCLHYGEPRGPKSVVVTGMTDGFSTTIQDENLDDYVVGVVARLGGFVVMRELARDSKWAVLEKEDSFRQLRSLLLAQNLRTVVGISLQAKERTLGVLLLGTPDHRNFTPAECRLLLALGHQIGMAVENSYLIQQTSRRSEELHILNEIGRALSSTLEPEALFDRLYREIRRLLEIESFFIALFD